MFLTGATGFLGHYLLRDLLRGGFDVVALLRSPVAVSGERLRRLLAEIDPDASKYWDAGRVQIIEGDLLSDIWHQTAGHPDVVVHCAASTQFDASEAAPPRLAFQGRATAELRTLVSRQRSWRPASYGQRTESP